MIRRLQAEADPEAALRGRGLDPSSWSAAPMTRFATHSHGRTKRLFVVSGDISFNGEWLRAPAGIRIDAGTEHRAEVGDRGVECVEAFE